MRRFIFLCIIITVFLSSEQLNAKNQPRKDKVKSIPMSSLKSTNLGEKTLPGKITFQNNTIEITAGGADIWGKNDEGYFSYLQVKGDFEMSVKVLNLDKTHLYTKAGIMAREDLSDNCKHVFYQVFPDNSPRNKNNGGCEFQYRAEKGGEMKAIYPNMETAGHNFDVNFPETWIKLKRAGNVFTSYMSNDNKTWHLYSTFEQKMPEKLVVGLAVTSHDSAKYTTASFESLFLIQ